MKATNESVLLRSPEVVYMCDVGPKGLVVSVCALDRQMNTNQIPDYIMSFAD